MTENNELKKYKAIKYLIENGSRGSEWQEAGLLHAIASVVNDGELDLSIVNLKALLKEAKDN